MAKNHEYPQEKTEEENEEEVDYDDVLSAAGTFGPYQYYLSAMVSPFFIFGGFVYFSQVFLTEVSANHWCWIPELENLTAIERRNLAIPVDNSTYGYSRCTSYVANWSQVLQTEAAPVGSRVETCQHGWEFNQTEIPYPTIASELGWVCENDSYQATAQSLFFVGSIIGGFLVGSVADRFGRVPAAVVANLIGCVAGACTVFARNFIEFTAYRVFMGMSYDNCMMMAYLLILEYTVPKYRTLVTNLLFAVFFTIGTCTLPWIALACGHWKTTALATSIPLAIALLAPILLPESPRWLISKGRVEQVVNNLQKISRVNNNEIPPGLIVRFTNSCNRLNKNEVGSLLDLFKRSSLRQMFLTLCLEYITCVIVFDALVRTISSLKFNFFISFTLISFTELPSLVLLSFIFDWTGRKWLINISMALCGLFSFLTPFVGGGLPSVGCAIVARFFVNMAYNGVLQWTAELMPTPLRGSATSVVHVCGYIATVISPFIAYLDHYISWLSLVVVGVVSVVSSVTALFLPETANKEMPQSLDDAELMMKTKVMFDMPWIKRKGNPRNENESGNVNESFEINL